MRNLEALDGQNNGELLSVSVIRLAHVVVTYIWSYFIGGVISITNNFFDTSTLFAKVGPLSTLWRMVLRKQLHNCVITCKFTGGRGVSHFGYNSWNM